MKDSTLLRISLATALIGIISLYIISNNLELEESNLVADQEYIKLRGLVEDIRVFDEVTSFTLSYSDDVKVVVFKELDLIEGSSVEVVGSVEEYRGEKEIIAESIKH